MKIQSKKPFFAGIAIFIILFLSYFVKINNEEGTNFQTYDRLLGIIIFHSAIVLSTYIVIAVLLIFFSVKKVKEVL